MTLIHIILRDIGGIVFWVIILPLAMVFLLLGDVYDIGKRLVTQWNAPERCQKHGCLYEYHGYDEIQFCPSATKEKGYYSME
jgi:hypothetical protein